MKSLDSLTLEQGKFFKEGYAARLFAVGPNDQQGEGSPLETTTTAMSPEPDSNRRGTNAQYLLRADRKRQPE